MLTDYPYGKNSCPTEKTNRVFFYDAVVLEGIEVENHVEHQLRKPGSRSGGTVSPCGIV
jgi:hypothetical protein